MFPATRFPIILLVLLSCAICFSADGQPAPAAAPASPGLKLPAIIGDHMLLQSGQEDPLWGWAPAGSPVQVEFLDSTGKTTLVHAATTATPDGKWSLKLPALPAGTTGRIKFTAGAQTKTISDVAVGEAWLCGGQSNMTYSFGWNTMTPEILNAAKQELSTVPGAIRWFWTQQVSADTPQDDSKGRWGVVTPNNLLVCPSVPWYFAFALHQKLNVPMGMVVCAVGGTRAEQWTSKAALDASPPGPALEAKYQQLAAKNAPLIEKWKTDNAAWLQANPTHDLQVQNAKTRPPGVRVWTPSEFYNGMLHGLEPYAVKGVIWFQADGNLNSVPIYGDLIKALITSWRADWQEELPFYYVEMNNMRDVTQTVPVKYNPLSLLREQQAEALTLPLVDVACSIDCGLPTPEPHFPNKEPVGQRLAALAFDHVYGFPGPCHSPAYKSFAVEGNKLRVHFDYAEGLRVRGGGAMAGFAIRGAGGQWVWAQGQVDGQDVLLWNDQVPQPEAARYAWAANPITSMENGAGFPLRPFRTDTDSPQ
jgi:sialate O-acetylesterase